jgi:putative addiction module killer protein
VAFASCHRAAFRFRRSFRIDYGPGYRVYFTRRGKTLVILLCGGDKKSQRKDIALAKKMAKEA